MLSYDSTLPIPGQQPPKADLVANSMGPQVTGTPVTNFNSTMAAAAPPSKYNHHHIWLVTGPAGCGKTSVAEHLAGVLSMPYIEGDSVRHFPTLCPFPL
jgi:gluconokinase